MAKGKWFIPVLAILSVVVLIAAACARPPATPTPTTPKPTVPVEEVVKIGALQDITGATSDVGKDEALGVIEATAYFNDLGGINGKPIKLFQYDYGYRVPEAVTTYKRFRDYDKVICVAGWGTGDTEALAPTVTKDKMVYCSSSFSGHLCDPKRTPYNFVYSSDYSTKARATLQYWYDNYWLKDPRYKADREAGVKPRLIFFAAKGVPYSTAPLEALEDQAKILGMEVGPLQDVSLWALDTKSQVMAAKRFDPHVIWHGNTTMSVATAIKDSYALGLSGPGKKCIHLVNCWGFDENLIKLAGKAAEETLAAAVCAYFVWDYPAKDIVVKYAKKIHPGVPLENRLIRTVQGYLKIGLLVQALKAMDKAGELDLRPEALAKTRAGLKKYMEADFSEFTKKFGLPEYVTTPTDHRPSSKVVIAQIKNGEIINCGIVDMKAMYPDLWPKWLGW